MADRAGHAGPEARDEAFDEAGEYDCSRLRILDAQGLPRAPLIRQACILIWYAFFVYKKSAQFLRTCRRHVGLDLKL
jgi:hypothetical protein